MQIYMHIYFQLKVDFNDNKLDKIFFCLSLSWLTPAIYQILGSVQENFTHASKICLRDFSFLWIDALSPYDDFQCIYVGLYPNILHIAGMYIIIDINQVINEKLAE